MKNDRHDVIKFEFSKKREKMSLANICRIICEKFNQNRHNRLGCIAGTDRQTERQTDRDTHSHTNTHTLSVSIATYSVKMTEYKNRIC